MSFQHEYPYGDVHELNLDWIIQTMQEFINSEREAGNTPTVSSVRNFFTHKYPYGDIHELNLDWVIQTALRMEEIGDSVEDDIEDLQTRMTAAEGNISTLDNTVSGLSDSIDQIESDIDDIQDDVADLETTTGQHTTQIAALDAKIDAQVVANPTDAATDTLNKIKIAGTVYDVQGSGGSEVEANPAGAATGTLEKIGIDGTIYAVDGSEPVSKTVTGNPITIADAADAPIVSGTVAFEPIQDLNGYDKPWAGGAGKNLFSSAINSGYTINSAGTYVADANRSATEGFIQISPNTEYTLSYLNANNEYCGVHFYDANKDYIDFLSWGANPRTFTSLQNSYYVRFSFRTNTVITNAQLELGSTPTSFVPYSNICPITGYTDCGVEVTDGTTTNTYTIDLDGTRYGGAVYPVTGKLSDSMGHIASYNGETIGEPWLSDRDEYVAGTTPTTGAEVVYTLASPTIVQLIPEQIRTLEGTNNISTNMTNMSLEYITEDYQPLVKLIERRAGHHYSTQERVVGTWIDGKPVYEKTYSSLNVLINDTSSWFRTGIIISDINAIVGAGGIDTSNQYWSVSACIYSADDEVGISIASLVGAAGGRVIDTLTFRYTKTTD